nr:IS110 family transposase [Streptomyces sp. IMTB 2501]
MRRLSRPQQVTRGACLRHRTVHRAPHDHPVPALHSPADSAPPGRGPRAGERDPAAHPPTCPRITGVARCRADHCGSDPGWLVDPGRFRSEAAFASFAGVAPAARSSRSSNDGPGRTRQSFLNRLDTT